MTINDIKSLKEKFFKGNFYTSEEYLFIEDVKIHENDNEYVVELKITSIGKNNIDGRRALHSYNSTRHVKINDNQISPKRVLDKVWDYKNINEITKEEFKKELFDYFDETYYRIFKKTLG